MRSLDVVFRADAGPETGGGHVYRCLALAAALTERGLVCGFASRPLTETCVPSLGDSGVTCRELDCEPVDEAANLAQWSAAEGAILVVDHYQRGEAFERECRSWASRVVVIDDVPDRRHDCDLLLDQSFGRTAREYQGKVVESSRLLLGTHYALLRAQFARERDASLARRRAEVPRRILVSVGASDPGRMTGVLLEGIRLAAPTARVDVAGVSRDSVDADVSDQVLFHGHVDAMAELMRDADLAVGAAGSSSWERCCLGLPAIVTTTAENQRHVALALVDAGAAVALPSAGALDRESVADGILELASHPSRLLSMSRAAAALCDGAGAARVAEEVVRLRERVGA